MNVEPFSLPLSRPLETAAGTIDKREGFVVRAIIGGIEGIGEATPLAGWTESLDDCKRALRGVEDPRSALETGELIGTPAARHGISLAVLDAAARAANRPLYRHLGATGCRVSVPVNATIGDGTPTETSAAATTAASEGYPAVKLKVGSRPPTADVDRIKAVRERCPDIELRIDANGAWNTETALRLLPTLADLDVTLVEQPLPADELADHGRLRGHGVDIAIDEGLSEHDPEAVLTRDVADVLVCKPMVLGGVDRAREVINAAEASDMDAIVTTTVDGAIARAAAVHLAASIPNIRPCGLATAGMLGSDLDDSIARVEDGSVAVPQRKGNIPRR